MPRRPRPTRLTRLALAVAVVVALGAPACGGSDDVTQSTFATELQERTTVPESVATCLTDKIYSEFDQGEIDRIYRAATPTELDDDVRATLTTFNQECIEAEPEETTDDEDSTTTSEGESDSSTTTSEG